MAEYRPSQSPEEAARRAAAGQNPWQIAGFDDGMNNPIKEVVKGIGDITGLRPDALPQPDLASTRYGAGLGEVPNPEHQRWKSQAAGLAARKTALQTKLALPFSNKESIQAQIQEVDNQISALGPEPPKMIPNQLAQTVQGARDQQQQTGTAVDSQKHVIQQAGSGAYHEGQGVNTQARTDAGAAAGRDAPQVSEDPAVRDAQLAGMNRAANFTPDASGAEALEKFRGSRQGLDALMRFSEGPQGPSAAAAQLRMQSDKDKRTALALARSARGGPAAVAAALRRAQAEGAAISAETRGQASVLQAQEADMHQQRQLQALTGAAGAEGTLDANQIAALSEAANVRLEGSAQELGGIRVQNEAAGNIRSDDLETSKVNISAQLQQLGLNDQQVQFFSSLGEQARQEGIRVYQDALSRGLDAELAMAQVNAAYIEMAWRMLTTEQQMELERIAIQSGIDMSNAQAQQQFYGQVLGFGGTVLTAYGMSSGRDK